MYRAHLSHWLLECRINNHSGATILTNTSTVTKFLDFLGEQETSRPLINAYFLKLRDENAKPSTQLMYYRRCVVLGIFRRMTEEQ